MNAKPYVANAIGRHFAAEIRLKIADTGRTVFSHFMRDDSREALERRIAELPARYIARAISIQGER